MGTQNQIMDPLDRHEEGHLAIIINSCRIDGNKELLARAEAALTRKKTGNDDVQDRKKPDNYYFASQGRA